MLSRKMKMYLKMYQLRIIIISVIVFVVILSIWGLMSSMFLRGGFSKMSRRLKVHGELVSVKWSDVVGMENVKEEAREVVELISDRVRVKKIGGKILRGILMIGPPG